MVVTAPKCRLCGHEHWRTIPCPFVTIPVKKRAKPVVPGARFAAPDPRGRKIRKPRPAPAAKKVK